MCQYPQAACAIPSRENRNLWKVRGSAQIEGFCAIARAGGCRQENSAVGAQPLDVAATIEDAVDDDERRRDVESDRDAPLEPYNPQTWPQLVPPDTTLRKGVEREAVRPDSLHIGIRPFRVGPVGDEIVDLKKVIFSRRCETDSRVLGVVIMMSLAF